MPNEERKEAGLPIEPMPHANAFVTDLQHPDIHGEAP